MTPRALAVAALSAVALSTGWLPHIPAAAAPAQADAADAASSADGARLQLVDQQFAVEPDGDLRLDYLLTGLIGDPLELLPPPEPEPAAEPDADTTVPPEPAPPPPVELTLEITNYTALDGAADLVRLVGAGLDPEAAGAVGPAVDGVALDARPLMTRNDDGTVALSIVVGTDVTNSVRERLKLEAPGLYPIRVQLLRGDPADNNVVATAGTVVQRLAGAVDVGVSSPPPIDLSVIATTAPTPPNATSDDIETARAGLERAIDLSSTLDAAVTIEVSPEQLSEYADTPDAADELTEALTGDELVARPLLPLDVSAAVAAGRSDNYTRLLRAGENLLTETVPTIPSVRSVVITADALSGAGAQHLRDLGARVVIMTAELYASSVAAPDAPTDELPTDLLVEASLPDGGSIAILVVDPLSEELTEAAADEILTAGTDTEWAVATLAEMLLDQATEDATSPLVPPRRTRVLATPELRSPDGRLVSAIERLVDTTTAFRFAPASTIIGTADVQSIDGDPVQVQLPDVAGPDLTARVELLDRTAFTMASAASMLPDDDPRPLRWSEEIDALISTGFSDDDVDEAVADLLDEADTLKAAVQLPDPFTFTLTGRNGNIEVRIANTADESLDVVVDLSSTKVEFPDGPQQITLRPLSETSVVVPVVAESNGTSAIMLAVSTPAGEQLGDEVNLTARVTALTGLGQVLTGGLIVVVLTWWFSHWRARRREALLGGRERHPSNAELESDTL